MDYILSYKDNDKVGDGKVIIIGIGNYKYSSIEKEFIIKAKEGYKLTYILVNGKEVELEDTTIKVVTTKEIKADIKDNTKVKDKTNDNSNIYLYSILVILSLGIVYFSKKKIY